MAPMLQHRRSLRGATLTLVLLAHVGAAVLLTRGEVAPALLVAAASHMLLLWGTLRPGSPLLGPVVNRLDTGDRMVWLTIDDGPSADTPAMLALLEAHGARATFFLVGANVRRHRAHVAAILAAGHQVGNHTDSHPSAWFWSLPPRAIEREIAAGQAAIAEAAAGTRPQLFRAAVGMANMFVAPALRRHRLLHIGWSARGFDAVSADPDTVARRVGRDLAPGAIILLHEGAAHGRSVETLDRVLRHLKQHDYRCVLPALPPTPAAAQATPRPASC